MSIYYIKQEERHKLKKIVDGWNETMIWSCLQGYMGEAYVDDLINPKSVQMVVCDFCFFAGIVNEELVRNNKAINGKYIVMVAENEDWNSMIEKVYPNCKRVNRYAIKKEGDNFDRDKLKRIVCKLPKEYEIKMINNKDTYNDVMKDEWSKYLCSSYKDCNDFINRGIGVVIYHDKMLVSGASSYSSYDKGIEIEVDTRQDYRRKGLAYAACAKLILECLDRGLYPSYDAQNKSSVALSEKLGYNFDHEYIAYEVTW